MSRTSRIIAIVGIVGLFAASAAVVAFVVRQAPDSPITGVKPSPPPALPPTPSPNLSASPEPSPTPPPPGSNALLGTDGRLTVLLLGSDYRPAHPGNRTDAIMVVSVDPTTGRSGAFSVPRDTVNFPMPTSGTYSGKVNALYQHLLSTTRNGGAAMKQAVGRAFGIEIDSYVFIGFQGLKQLVAAVGGVDVTLEHAYYDAHYWVNAHHQGWGLPAGTSHLNAADALIFARSRKGDNDFNRARRQQQLVAAALKKVRERPQLLPQLLTIASRTVRTDLKLDRATELFNLFSTVDISKTHRAVFGPRTYASSTGGTSFALKLDVCRRWIKGNFPPARPNGIWPLTPAPSSPPASPAPSPSAS